MYYIILYIKLNTKMCKYVTYYVYECAVQPNLKFDSKIVIVNF